MHENIKRKAYEVAYALGRLGGSTEGGMGNILIGKGIGLLDAAIRKDKNETENLVSAIGYFIKLGAGLGSIGQGNADLLLGELNILVGMISKEFSGKKEKIIEKKDIDLSDIFSDGFGNEFSKAETQEPAKKEESQIPIFLKSLRGSGDEVDEDNGFAGYPARDEIKREDGPNNTEQDRGERVEEISNSGENRELLPLSASIRQSSILNNIRQSGNCRIKDLQDIFPQYSERTIRYDIESLIRKKLVERVGAGSATTYRPMLKNIANK